MSDITWTNDTRKLSDLVPWENNPKRMTKKQADGLRLSIERFGFAVPFLVSPDGDIYDGHQRQTLMGAIKEYGPNAVVDVRVSSRPLTDDERRELVVRLKQNQAGWDFDMLPNLYEREELLEWGFEPEELGLYPDDEPEGDDPGPQIDRADELREKWGVETGQLWQLGEHRLICGDCTDAAVVARLGTVDALFTDPPYGISIDTGWLTALNVKRGKPANMSDDLLQGDDGTLDLSFLWQYDRRMVWGFPYIFDPQAAGWIVWDKQPGVEDRGIVTPIEMASTTMRKGFDMVRVMWGGYYRAAGEDRQPHPTQKPIGVVAPFIEAWTKQGETVFDPFLGSGTTLIACERLGRRCRAVEISSGYVAVALERWATMTGQEPVLLDVTG